MTQTEFNELLLEVLRGGVRLTMYFNKTDNKVWYNLNTGMKSDLHMTYDEEARVIRVEGRYEHKAIVTDFDELMWEVRGCMHGRDFMSGDWAEFMDRYNYA